MWNIVLSLNDNLMLKFNLKGMFKTIENKFPIFSDLPAEDPRSVQPNDLLSLFLAMLRAVWKMGDFLARTPPADKMVN